MLVTSSPLSEAQYQLEIATDPLSPMEALDALIYTHEVIKNLAVQQGMRATITPKPLLEGAPSGAHLHLSILPVTQHEYFLAGVLSKLLALCAFSMPSFESYFRVKDSYEVTGSWVCWGTENRKAPIRKIRDGHWEFRFVDATTNSYILLASLLQAGLRGIKGRLPLTWKDLHYPPALLSKAELEERAVTKRLSGSLR